MPEVFRVTGVTVRSVLFRTRAGVERLLGNRTLIRSCADAGIMPDAAVDAAVDDTGRSATGDPVEALPRLPIKEVSAASVEAGVAGVVSVWRSRQYYMCCCRESVEQLWSWSR